MESNDNVLRWGTEQRLEFIEFKCFWEGGIRRGDITDRFNVSVPQASNDLSLYQGLEPENIRYDTREKRYVPTASFTPRFFKPSAERYLAQLKMIADRIISIDDTWIAHPPPIDALPIPFRSVRPDVFKSLLGAIRAKQSVEIFYQSMSKSRPDAVWRRVTPRAFGNDGLRWHVRAFCHLDRAYKDFILSRCENLRDQKAGDGFDVPDREWETFFEVVLRPNPALSASQQRTVALDYAMEDGRAHISVRRALLYYFQKRLRLDIDTDRPAERPVVVENWDDFRAALLEDKNWSSVAS